MKTKIDFMPKDDYKAIFKVSQKDDWFFSCWREVGQFDNLIAAKEFSLSRGEKVNYLGVFLAGKRIEESEISTDLALSIYSAKHYN